MTGLMPNDAFMTNPTLAPEDPRSRFASACASAGEVIAQIRPDQMTLPTPCDAYDVRNLLGHVLAVAQRVAYVGRSENPFLAPEFVEGIADQAWVATWHEAGDAVQSAWADDATLTRIVELPWATLPGAATLTMWASEVVTHTWDLVQATGQQPPLWDPALLAESIAFMAQALPAEGRAEEFEAARSNMPEGEADFEPPFASAVAVPADAPLIDRLVAWTGRTPT